MKNAIFNTFFIFSTLLISLLSIISPYSLSSSSFISTPYPSILCPSVYALLLFSSLLFSPLLSSPLLSSLLFYSTLPLFSLFLPLSHLIILLLWALLLSFLPLFFLSTLFLPADSLTLHLTSYLNVFYCLLFSSPLCSFRCRWTIKARVTCKSDIRRWSNAKGEGHLFSIDLMDSAGEAHTHTHT